MDQLYRMGVYDYLVIGFYFIFMLTDGVYFNRTSKTSSDYFRGGMIGLTGAALYRLYRKKTIATGAAR
jgi:Na+/proline symporter